MFLSWQEHKLDLLRVCFDENINGDDENKAREMASKVEDEMKKQVVIMRGNDRQNRGTMIKFARLSEGTDQEGYVLCQIYAAERSIAVTEFLSMGHEERSVAIYDYNGFDSKNSPPFACQVAAATLLQKLYPERLQTLVMVEPPFWLRGLLTLLSPFLSTAITDRIKMASGEVIDWVRMLSYYLNFALSVSTALIHL